MERIFLRMNELNKYNIINDLVLGKINKNRAYLILNLTRINKCVFYVKYFIKMQCKELNA